jgi:WD40 repeat protein
MSARALVAVLYAELTALRTLDVAQGVQTVTFSPDGRIVAAGIDQMVRTWEVDGGKPMHEVRGPVGVFLAAAFSPDGKVLAMTGQEQTLLWDAATGKKLGTLAGRGGKIAFAPDGKFLAVAGDDYRIRLWDWATSKEIRKLQKLPDRVRSLGFRPTARRSPPCPTGDPRVRRGNRETVGLPGHQRVDVRGLHPRWRGIVTTAWDGTVRSGRHQRQGNARRGRSRDKSRDHRSGTVKSVTVSPNGQLVAAARGLRHAGLGRRHRQEVHRFRPERSFSPESGSPAASAATPRANSTAVSFASTIWRVARCCTSCAAT